MREVDVKCKGEMGKDGLCNLVVTITNLTKDEAIAIGDSMRLPLNDVINRALNRGSGEVSLIRNALAGKLQ